MIGYVFAGFGLVSLEPRVVGQSGSGSNDGQEKVCRYCLVMEMLSKDVLVEECARMIVTNTKIQIDSCSNNVIWRCTSKFAAATASTLHPQVNRVVLVPVIL